jgi:hypothetical protein
VDRFFGSILVRTEKRFLYLLHDACDLPVSSVLSYFACVILLYLSCLCLN